MKKIWFGIFVSICLLTTCAIGCTARQEDMLKDFAVLTVDDKEHVISRKDSNRLRELLDTTSGWEDCEAGGSIGEYEVVLDGVQYNVDTKDREHPIHTGSHGSMLKGAMSNADKSVVKEIYRILEKWSRLEHSYEYFLLNNQIPGDKATLSINNDGTDKEYVFSEEDTKKLREFFAADSGWMERVGCECIGNHEITIDNIRYVIDITDMTHEVKYGLADGSAEYSIYCPTSALRKICQIIEKTMQ